MVRAEDGAWLGLGSGSGLGLRLGLGLGVGVGLGLGRSVVGLPHHSEDRSDRGEHDEAI